MFTHLCFIVLVFLQPKQKSFTRKSAYWFSRKTHKHWGEYDLILYFHFLFKLTQTEVLIYRYVDRDSDVFSQKRAPNLFREFTRESLLGRSLIYSMHSFCTTRLITLPHFRYLTANEHYRLSSSMILWCIEVLNIVTIKIFKTKF